MGEYLKFERVVARVTQWGKGYSCKFISPTDNYLLTLQGHVVLQHSQRSYHWNLRKHRPIGFKKIESKTFCFAYLCLWGVRIPLERHITVNKRYLPTTHVKQLSVIYFVCSHDPSHSSFRKHKVGLICRIYDKVSVCHDVLSQLNLVIEEKMSPYICTHSWLYWSNIALTNGLDHKGSPVLFLTLYFMFTSKVVEYVMLNPLYTLGMFPQETQV